VIADPNSDNKIARRMIQNHQFKQILAVFGALIGKGTLN
jgi:hypothetical protein